MTVLRIKPVAKGYFPTNKVTLREIAKVRRAGIAIFATRMNADGSMTDVFLIPEPAKRLKTGMGYAAEHMETGRKYGTHEVVAVLEFKFKNGMLQVRDAEPCTEAYAQAFEYEGVAFQLA